MKTRKRLSLAVISLAAALLLAAGSTFAWISINNRAVVDQFNVSASTNSNSLRMSVDGEHYYQTITTDMLFESMGLKYTNDGGIMNGQDKLELNQVTYLNTTEAAVAGLEGVSGAGFYRLTEEPNTDATAGVFTKYTKLLAKNGESVKLYTKEQIAQINTDNAGEGWTNLNASYDSWYFAKGNSYTLLAYSLAAADLTALGTAGYKTTGEDTLTYTDAGTYILDTTAKTVEKCTTPVEETSGRYLSFKLYFESNTNNADSKIYLGDGSAITPVGDYNSARGAVPYYDAVLANYGGTDGTMIDTANGLVWTRAAYAVRVGFDTSLNDAAQTTVYDPYKTNTVSFNSDSNLARYISYREYMRGGTAAEAVTEAAKLYATAASDNVILTNGQKVVGEATPLLALAKVADKVSWGYVGEMTVNIWLEGRDGDCFSSILDDSFSVALNFVLFPE